MRRWAQFVPELLVPLGALVLSLAIGVVLILAIGRSPALAFTALWRAAFASRTGIAETLINTTPLIFTGLSVALAFRCGLFNIGAEGQYLAGQIATAYVGYRYPFFGPVLALAALVAGGLAGALWGAIPGLLKAYRGVHEVVNTIMLNYIALFLASYLVIRFLHQPGAEPATPEVAPGARLGILLAGTRLHTGLLVALLLAVLTWVLLWRTTLGYSIRAVGLSPWAAEYGGINVGRHTVIALSLAGALAGLGGAVQVLGVQRAFYDPIGGFVGYGFDAIAVALLGRNHPFGLLPAALLFGILERGSGAMQAVAGVPRSMVWVVQATIIFFVATDGLIRRLLRRSEVMA